MRNLTLHKFLAMLLMTVSSATLSVAQNVAKNVAKIGTTEYATLKAAVYDATAGQTVVTLINDVDLTTDDELEVGKLQDIVLDMNGHSIKGANADYKTFVYRANLLSWTPRRTARVRSMQRLRIRMVSMTSHW